MKSLFTPGEPVTLIALPRIHSLMTGVSTIEISHPRYRLNYVDGTTEEGTLSDKLRGADVFSLISAVQEKRP